MKSWIPVALSLALLGCSERAPYSPISDAEPTFIYDDSALTDRIVIDEVDSIDEDDAFALSQELQNRFGLTMAPATSEEDTHIWTGFFDPEKYTQKEIISYLAQNPLIQHVEPVYTYHILDLPAGGSKGPEPVPSDRTGWVPNDPDYPKQWSFPEIGMGKAWGYTAGYNVTVAVIDTGISCQAPDLQQTICVPGWDFVNNREDATDDHAHGTHVAGTIAQSTNNGLGVSGIAFKAKLMPIKVLAAKGGGTTVDIADGIRFAADHGAQVINMSLGGGGKSQVLMDAINYAHAKGVTIVAAAGNDKGRVNYPAAYDNVIGVSAYQSGGAHAEFTSRGPEVDIAGPGVNILQQTLCRDRPSDRSCFAYEAFNGTSMATPHVAGVAALIISEGVTDPDAVEKVLEKTARKTDRTENNPNLFGAGYLEAEGAVKSIGFWNGVLRAGLIVVALLFITRSYKKIKGRTGMPMMAIGAAISGVGLFFLPMFLHTPSLATFILSHPLGELDLAFIPQFHQYLPAALPILSLALIPVTWQRPGSREFAAGVSLGLMAVTAVTLGTGAVGYGFLTLVSAAVSLAGNGLVAWMNLFWRHSR